MLKRTITAIVAILFFFPFIIYGSYPLYFITVMIGSIGLYELLKMRQLTTEKIPVVLGVLLLWTLILPDEVMTHFSPLNQIDLLMIIAILLSSYTVIKKNSFHFSDVSFIIFGTIYVGLGFHYFLVSRDMGLEYVFFAIVVILLTDTGAYLAGNLFGKNKLIPAISPNKTIEGAIGGAFLGVLAGTIFHLIFPIHDSLLFVISVSFFASIIGQMGDLTASALKRHYEVKDSGKLLPGHGGILDRFDSWLFVFPFLYIIQLFG